MAAAPTGPRTVPGEPWPTTLSLLLLLFLLPPTQVAATAHRHPASEEVAFSRDPVASVLCKGRYWEAWMPLRESGRGRSTNTEAYDIYVGLVDLLVAGNHTQWFEVNRVIIHPTYELYHPIGGDVALVQLKTRIVFSDAVLPICIAPPDLTLSNLSCWATGWGSISQQGDTSNTLQEVQLPLVPLHLCRQLYGQTSIQPDMLCAGSFRDMKTACEGDSGSPLVCEFNHTWVQIGVVSWGKGCTYPMFPTVFARVSFFSRWIQHHIENTPVPLQPLPALSPTPGAIINILMTSLAALSML
nr:serine protease 38 isoform X2 [Odocoileus virginianus texanus]